MTCRVALSLALLSLEPLSQTSGLELELGLVSLLIRASSLAPGELFLLSDSRLVC